MIFLEYFLSKTKLRKKIPLQNFSEFEFLSFENE